MLNKAMECKLKEGTAIDVGAFPQEGGRFILPSFNPDAEKDYCHKEAERWIWSIGRRKSDGVILASFKTDLYDHPDFECVWLR